MDLFNVYPLYGVTPVKALGAYVWDENNTKYLDLYGGHGVISIGHTHPDYVKAISNQLNNIAFYSNSIQNPLQKELAEKLGKLSGCEKYNLFLFINDILDYPMRYILSFSFFLCTSLFAYAQSNIYQVGFLLDKNTIEISDLIVGLSDEILAVVGEDAVIEFPESSKLVNNFDSVQALNNYNTLLQNDTDIIIAFGIVNNSVISKLGTYQKPTILFGALPFLDTTLPS